MTARMIAIPRMRNTLTTESFAVPVWPGASGTNAAISARMTTPTRLSPMNDQRQSRAVPMNDPSGVPSAKPTGAPVETMAS
jgi:hypothetical protein